MFPGNTNLTLSRGGRAHNSCVSHLPFSPSCGLSLPFFFLQVVTAGPVVYSIILNGASQPGGQTGTALLPLFDLLNHDIQQEVKLEP